METITFTRENNIRVIINQIAGRKIMVRCGLTTFSVKTDEFIKSIKSSVASQITISFPSDGKSIIIENTK
jgi:uncharacterized protein (DUF934 family)